MQPREKKLLAIGLAVFGVFLLRDVFSGIFLAPLNNREGTISTETAIVSSLEKKQDELIKAVGALAQYRAESLPPIPLDAQREYQEWLTDLALVCDWQNPKPTLLSLSPRGAATAIPVSIKAQATLENINRLLQRLESTAVLQRVTRLKIDSPTFDGNPLLAVELTTEGMAVSGADARTRLFPTAELNAEVNAEATTLSIAHASEFPKTAPFVVRIENELVEVQGVAGDQWTVARGVHGSHAAVHEAAAPIELTPSRATVTTKASHPVPSVHRLFVRVPEAGRLQVIAEQTPAIRGREWSSTLKVQNWDPAEGDPRLELAAGAPTGMSLDARDSKLTWTTPDDFKLGPIDVGVNVYGRDPQTPVIESKIAVEVRRPNSAPKLETPATADVWLGRPWKFPVPVTDPDLPNDNLKFTIGGTVPQGLTINAATGELAWSPPAEADLGEFPLEITVTDGGQPPASDTRTLTLRLADDNALYTYLIGTVVENGVREAWLYDRSANRRTVVREGEQVKVADITGTVRRIAEESVEIESGGQTYRLDLGQNLREWTQTTSAERPANADSVSGSADSSGT
jgi:hypothetical protein